MWKTSFIITIKRLIKELFILFLQLLKFINDKQIMHPSQRRCEHFIQPLLKVKGKS